MAIYIHYRTWPHAEVYVCMYVCIKVVICMLYIVCAYTTFFQLDPSRAQLAGCESRAVLASHRKQWCLI